MSELAVHPVAALFPMLADDELEELAADIKARGLRLPIIRDKEGKTLIDGRNRLVACEKAGVQPDFIT
jgi:ParB-like chromosome segregation protein Spo0J